MQDYRFTLLDATLNLYSEYSKEILEEIGLNINTEIILPFGEMVRQNDELLNIENKEYRYSIKPSRIDFFFASEEENIFYFIEDLLKRLEKLLEGNKMFKRYALERTEKVDKNIIQNVFNKNFDEYFLSGKLMLTKKNYTIDGYLFNNVISLRIDDVGCYKIKEINTNPEVYLSEFISNMNKIIKDLNEY